MAKLAQITEMKTISKKLRCLVEASNMILRCVDEYYKPELRMDRPAEEISSSNNNIQREENEEDNDGFFSIM